MKKLSVLIAAGALGILTAGAGYAQETEISTEAVTAPQTPSIYLPRSRPSELYIGNNAWFADAKVTLAPMNPKCTPETRMVPANGVVLHVTTPYNWPGCQGANIDAVAITVENVPQSYLTLASNDGIFQPGDEVKQCETAFLASTGTLQSFPYSYSERSFLEAYALDDGKGPQDVGVYFTANDPSGKGIGQGSVNVKKGQYKSVPLDSLVFSTPANVMPYGQVTVTTSGSAYVGNSRTKSFHFYGGNSFEKAKGRRLPGPGIFGCTE